ncbi:MAG: hypothetical protein HN411_01620 [Waddliaceae bacterium]|jgi:hypothetical protein|nr:hypothetical protein [Waddliaceae bacterium]MBT3578489.1 hypothetical protein [Waddliaceae bacterium]MBT4444931.1 hypothetical protein [Waddliaceae bacterium]MBT6927974.1 hypothetical protein [Waddliaceae bacterium]MBT7263910.1 hypothetical protein [Waddliaceae bacterium]
MINATIPEILAVLKKDGYNAQVQEETGQIYFIITVEKRDIAVFLRTLNDGKLVQLIAFMPYEVQEKLFGSVGRLLHYINKEIDMPGFGMDETTHLVFYRNVIPTTHKKLDEMLFYNYLKTLERVCNEFLPAIEPLALGATTYDEVLAKAKVQEKQSTS